MASTDRQPSPKPFPVPGAVLELINGTICTMVKPGRHAPPLTIFMGQRGEAEREIPLAEVAKVLWSP